MQETHEAINIYYTTREALSYLNDIWKPRGVTITKDRFYHAIIRSGKQYRKMPVGKVERYMFTLDELNELRFYGGAIEKPHYEHVQITSLEQLKPLEKKYGKLVTEEGLAKILEEKYHKKYAITSIRQRLRRGDIDFVAYGQIGKYKTYWYPAIQLEEGKVRFYPKLVKNNS